MGGYTQILCGLVVLWLWASNGLAAPCALWVTRVVSIEGTIEVKRLKQGGWSRIQLNDEFCAGDSIRADVHSRAGLLLRNETLLRLDQGTTLVLPQLLEEDSAWLELVRGAVHFISNIPYRLKIKTPFVNAAIEGTEFAVRVSDANTKVWVLEGKVLVDNPQGSISLGPGDAAVAEAGKPPLPYSKIKPRDAVQWALHYPPIIDYRSSTLVDPQRQRAVTLYRTGQIPAAIEALNSVPDTARDNSFFTQRAALLLTVGQAQSAQKDIDKALALSPNSGAPRALQSVIALTQNDKDKALSLAQEAVKLEPKSPTPQVALSYAQQAAFDIEGARESIKKALELAPDDPLAWARLSELELSAGELDDALDAAKKAEALDPELSRTQMILGFAQLTEIDIDEAKESFTKAIALDPSAPLPRLGMGLAKIRQGDVEEGRKDIEVAAILDPKNSLIRSYLGKAYYEEKRGNVASREFAMAKHLDPKDPTPWFYDAIHKQTTNRPVEALHDIQKAIELNDNRAVYRSRLLLDDDLGARSASLGRIYNDLDFGGRALVEGWYSTASDPSDYSAHRLLADTYASRSGHQQARVSELLQSQLLQPLNITPVQPQLAETDLLILENAGPGSLSFNEFNPIFAGNRLGLQVSGVVGSNDTFGDEVTHSGLWRNFSYSLGQFHVQTGGFRDNNNIKQDVYNAFVQIAVTPKFNVQAEYRRSEREQGDLLRTFDPEDFSLNLRQKLQQDIYRFGARYSPSSHSSLIFSGFYTHGKDELRDRFFGSFDIELDNVVDGYQIEGQYLFRNTIFNTQLGGGLYDSRLDSRLDFFGPSIISEENNNQVKFYFYTNVSLPRSMIWTLGASYDAITGLRDTFSFFGSDEKSNLERWSPKFGLQWNLTNSLRLRAAYFQALGRVRVVDQSIEPTQIAGFNQFFDDPVGTKTERYGVGLDIIFNKDLYAGVEYSQRQLEFPSGFDPFGQQQTAGRQEKLARAYVYWTPHKQWAMSAEIEYEQLDRSIPEFVNFPSMVETLRMPLTIRYFHPSGFFSSLGGTLVRQKINGLFFQPPLARDHDTFFLLDASIGYRLPNRLGIISLQGFNLLNQQFLFQDRTNLFSTGVDQAPPIPDTKKGVFIPDRTIFLRATFAFD